MSVLISSPVDSGYGASPQSLSLTGIDSGQPIIVIAFECAPTGITDTFATPYTWTQINSNGFVASWVGTGGTGTSGTITTVGGSAGAIVAVSFLYAALGTAPASGTFVSANGTQVTVPMIQSEAGYGFIAAAVSYNSPGINGFTGVGCTDYLYASGGNTYGGVALYENVPASVQQDPTWTQAVSSGFAAIGVYVTPLTPTAPSAPTLTAPTNASYQDVSSGITLGPADYNSTDGQLQNAYALRIKLSGASSYSYWNASTGALQSSIVWNSDSVAVGGNWSVALPSGVLSNGNVYNWSMASQESYSDLQGSFATDFTFTAQTGATVVVTGPSGLVVGTTIPQIDWTTTLASGATATNYEVIVESGPYGTAPGLGTSAWTSGVVSGSASSVVVGTPLTPGVTYRAFVQVTESGPEVSPWDYSTFTLQVDVPATPIFTAIPGFDAATGAPLVTLTIQGQDNQLTLNQASLESNVTTGWTTGPNTTIATSSTWEQDGAYSLEMTATAAGAVSASTPTGTSGVACSPGQVVRAMGFFHSPATVRACTAAITFYNSAGSVISTLTSTSVDSTLTGNGGQAFITGTAPALTASMSLTINGAGLSTSEVLYADCMLLGPGSSATWTTGGFVGGTVANFTFSDDGVNWFAVRNGTGLTIPTTNQTVSVADYEGSLGFTRQYKAQVVF